MKVVKILFMFVFHQCFAAGLTTYEVYSQNSDLLVKDISILEKINEKKSNELTKVILDEMYLLSDYFNLLDSQLMIESLISQARDAGWKNTELKSILLKEVCEEGNSFSLTICLKDLEELKKFITDSNLKEGHKNAVVTFCNEYSKQVLIKSKINKDFINNFNQHVNDFNKNFIKTKKFEETILQNIPNEIQKSSGHLTLNSSLLSLLNKKDVVAFCSLFFLLTLCSLILSKKYKNRKVKKFYSELFEAANVAKVKLRMFGKIEYSEVKKLKKLHKPLRELILNSKFISNKSEIKFKKRGTIFNLEIEFDSQRAIDNFLNNENQNTLSSGLMKIKDVVEELGGEIIICNKFSQKGELLYSNLLLQMTCP